MKRAQFVGRLLAAAALPQNARGAEYVPVRGAIERIPGIVGVYARTMSTGAALFSYHADLDFPAASTIKLVIMLTAFDAAARHPGAMHERIRYRSSELIGGSDFLAGERDGSYFTVEQLLVPMIQLSDNTASNLLITHFGFDEINRVARRAGMLRTHLRRHFLDAAAIVHHMDNRTTPRDMANLLYQIERGAREGLPTVASPAACRSMIRILLGQTDRNKIPAGLPQSVACANKTGEVDGVRNDVAIVEPFGDSPYVLGVFTKHLDNYAEAYTGIARISHLIYGMVAGSLL